MKKKWCSVLLMFVIVEVLSCTFVKWTWSKGPIEAPNSLWKGIIGESVSEGYSGMYAVTCVYRNRLQKGLPLGCVAMKRKDLDLFVKKQGVAYERMAKGIVRQVFQEDGKDVTNGATHYENIEKFGEPYWWKDMFVTAKIGDHTFCRLRTKRNILR